MRLIDADKLIDAFNIKCGEASCDTCRDLSKEHCMIYCTIEEQPTAYDVDKVVEELLVEYQQYDRIFDSTLDAYDLGKSHAYRDAIDIVKRGGVDE